MTRRALSMLALVAVLCCMASGARTEIIDAALPNLPSDSSAINGGTAGWLKLAIWSDTNALCTDTTTFRIDDTSSTTVITGDLARASITYKFDMWDGVSGRLHKDSVRAILVYSWSNNGTYWSDLDSSAAITDTLSHNDTLIIRPFNFMRIKARAKSANLFDNKLHPCLENTTLLVPWMIGSFRAQPFYNRTKY